jgi:hypothetical protein
MALTQVTAGLLDNSTQTYGMKNRIINGDMRINQRAYGSTAISTDPVYTLDRWRNSASGGGAFSSEQSTIAPANFVNSLKLTVTTVDSSITSAEYYAFQQIIEGYNIADFGFGTANAKPVTLSFWVRSSLTGTYGLTVGNSDVSRTYTMMYSIPVADTWTYITLSFPGDTSGTWLTTNGIGMWLLFILADGSGRQTATTNAWKGTFGETTSAQTPWIATNGATFYITGVQLEVGSTATQFDYRPYGTELAMCQRYYFKSGANAQGNANYQAHGAGGNQSSNTSGNIFVPFKQTMRVTPTLSYGGNLGVTAAGSYVTLTNFAASYGGTDSTMLQTNHPAVGSAGQGLVLMSNADATAFIAMSAEL